MARVPEPTWPSLEGCYCLTLTMDLVIPVTSCHNYLLHISTPLEDSGGVNNTEPQVTDLWGLEFHNTSLSLTLSPVTSAS